MKKVLLIVDVQVDFFPGGALPVPDGDEILPAANKYIELFKDKGYPVVCSRDWHPEKTAHFKDQGGEWPEHCVRGTRGAEFHPALNVPEEAMIISKGMGFDGNSYSAFLGKNEQGEFLEEILRTKGLEEIFIAGVATDFCVKQTALDALEKGFRVILLRDATSGIGSQGTVNAFKEISKKGARISGLEEVREKI